MIVGYSVIFLLIITALTFFSYRFSSQVLLEKTTKYLLESVVQMGRKIDVLLGEYDHLSQRLAYHAETQTYLQQANKNRNLKLSVNGMQKIITHEQAYIRHDMLIEVLDLNQQFAFHTISSLSVPETSWYPLVVEGRGRMVWTTNDIFHQVNNKDMIHGVLGVRQIQRFDSEKSDRIGYFFIVLPLDVIGRTIGNFIDASTKVQVFDQFGKIVYSTDIREVGTYFDRQLLKHFQFQSENISEVKMNGESVYLVASTSPYSNWTVTAFIKESTVLSDLFKVQQRMVIIGIFGLLAAVLLTSFFSWSLAKPIRYLTYRLSRIERGNLRPYKGTMTSREVTVLYETFNRMVENLDKTIKDLSLQRIRENQAQLIALKAQFQPHFLYNCLNIIYYYAVKDRQHQVADMVLTLSELLRYSIRPGSEFVPLEEDLIQLNRFIKFQIARYEDKLRIEMDVDEDLLQVPVMKLLLQPIVENALTHGLESVKGRTWLIKIHISRVNRDMLVVVEDNGKGMTPDQMEKALDFSIDAELANPMHSGLGIPNLHHRIHLIYGKKYGLKLCRSALGGLRVEVKIPIQKQQNAGDLA